MDDDASSEDEGLDARSEMSSLSVLSHMEVTPDLWLHTDWVIFFIMYIGPGAIR